MKIYFAGSIRGGREDASLYQEIVGHLKNYGKVLTEHVGDVNLHKDGEGVLSDREIHDRDLEWVLESDVLVAEVTVVSLGVGYEIGRAVDNGINVLCLYRPQPNKLLSGMINGCSDVVNRNYHTIDEAKAAIDEFFEGL
jgi:2'-deoxynucleoside 5'-phosphate N-hydrolase